MTKTKRTEEALLLGKGEEFIKVETDYSEGGGPSDLFVRDHLGSVHIMPMEALLRVAEAVKRAGWVPEGHYVCADHGLYDARSSDSAKCSRCEGAK